MIVLHEDAAVAKKELDYLKPPPFIKFIDRLAVDVLSLHGSRVGAANEVMASLLARVHQPQPGDDQAALDAIDVLKTEQPPYTIVDFMSDCATAVEIINLKREDEAGEAARAKLLAEDRNVRAETEDIDRENPPRRDFRTVNARRAFIASEVTKIDARHDAINLRLREMLSRSERVNYALRLAGLDIRVR